MAQLLHEVILGGTEESTVSLRSASRFGYG